MYLSPERRACRLQKGKQKQMENKHIFTDSWFTSNVLNLPGFFHSLIPDHLRLITQKVYFYEFNNLPFLLL